MIFLCYRLKEKNMHFDIVVFVFSPDIFTKLLEISSVKYETSLYKISLVLQGKVCMSQKLITNARDDK